MSAPRPHLTPIAGGFVADASKVTPRQFLDALGLVRDREQDRINLRADCTRAILRGDTYGYPAVLVHEIRAELGKPVCDLCGHELPEYDECANCSTILVPFERIAAGGVML